MRIDIQRFESRRKTLAALRASNCAQQHQSVCYLLKFHTSIVRCGPLVALHARLHGKLWIDMNSSRPVRNSLAALLQCSAIA